MARKASKRSSEGKQSDLALQSVSTALYIRVSTQKQADEGFGLDAQRSELDKYCESQNWIVSPEHIYVDAGVSGKSSDRPAFQRMMAAAQAGQVQRIVALKLDRIARNLKNLLQTVEELNQAGCALIVIKEKFDTSTPQGVFVLQMLGAVSELERSMIHERVHSGRVENALVGGYNGARCPLGYQYSNEVFTVIDGQAATVRRVFASFLSGQSLNAIAKAMNDADAPTAAGGAWYPATVGYILRNGQYAGLSQWDGVEVSEVEKLDDKGEKIVTTPYPPIISPATYEDAQRRLQSLRPGRQLESEITRRLERLAA